MYIYLRLVLRVDLQQMLIMRTQTTETIRSRRKNRWNHWSFIRVPGEIYTGKKQDPNFETARADIWVIVKVGGVLVALVGFAIFTNALLWMMHGKLF